MEDTKSRHIVQAALATPPVKHAIRDLTGSGEDCEKIWQMWQRIFPKWPIKRQLMEKLLYHLPSQHYIHEKGFCLSFLTEGPHGKIAAVGVLPEYRNNGLGTALIENAQAKLRNVARTTGEGELKSLEIGSQTPRFWPHVPIDFPQDVKDFFLHRGTANIQLNLLIRSANSVQAFTSPQDLQFEIFTKILEARSHHLKFWSESQRWISNSPHGRQICTKNA